MHFHLHEWNINTILSDRTLTETKVRSPIQKISLLRSPSRAAPAIARVEAGAFEFSPCRLRLYIATLPLPPRTSVSDLNEDPNNICNAVSEELFFLPHG